MKTNPLIPLGTNIKINKSKIENWIPEKYLDQLPEIINANIIDYKMTDGMDIGYILMTENNIKIWIFSNELDHKTKKEYKITQNNLINEGNGLSITQLNIDYELNGSKDIKTTLNPINFLTWLILVFKDIF